MSGNRSLPAVIIASAAALAIAVVAILTTVGSFRAVARKAAENRHNGAMIAHIFAPTQFPAPAGPNRLPFPAAVLAAQPLNPDALIRAGLTASIAGRDEVSAKLMNEVVRRDPRSKVAHLWLLTAALKHDDVPGAVTQLARLIALQPQSDAFFPTLAELARQPSAERPLAAAVAASPALWGDRFLGYLSSHEADRGLAFRLTMNTPRATNEGVPAAIIRQLIDKKDYDGAYLAWINLLPESALGSVAPVYDGNFAGLAGPLPFNWTFNDSDSASVGIERGEGLQVDYPSARSAQLASQLLVLKPGRYRIEYVAHGSGESDDGGVISWHLSCATTGTATLFDLPIKDLTDRPSAHAARFAVPAGCPAQTLSLEGTAGAFPKSRSVSIRRVTIAAVR